MHHRQVLGAPRRARSSASASAAFAAASLRTSPCSAGAPPRARAPGGDDDAAPPAAPRRSRAARARFVSSSRRANPSVADSPSRLLPRRGGARAPLGARRRRRVRGAAPSRPPSRAFLRLFSSACGSCALRGRARERLPVSELSICPSWPSQLRRASSALPRLDASADSAPPPRVCSLTNCARPRVGSARAPRARSAPRARRARPTAAGTSKLHALRLVASILLARATALARLARAKPRRPGRCRRSASAARAACSRGTPVRHTERRRCGSRKKVCHNTQGGYFVSAVRSARTPNASFSASFVAASTLFSSRLVCLVCPNGDPRVRRHEGGAAIAYLERVRPPARAGIAQSLEVRAVVVARFRVMVASRSCAWDGAWLGQGDDESGNGCALADGKDARGEPQGGAYLLPHARELARRQNDRTHGGRRSLAPRSRSRINARLRSLSFSGCERDDARKLTQQRECATRNKSSLKNREFRDEKISYEYLVTAHSLSHFVNQWL